MEIPFRYCDDVPFPGREKRCAHCGVIFAIKPGDSVVKIAGQYWRYNGKGYHKDYHEVRWLCSKCRKLNKKELLQCANK